MKAIKKGDVQVQFDTGFLFSEVNGDIVSWVISDDKKDISVVDVDRKYVGNYISTKAVGKKNLREDVTHCYKFPKGRNCLSVKRCIKVLMRFPSA